MRVFAIKNGLRYFKSQLESSTNEEKKSYYRSEIFRLENKLYELENKYFLVDD